MWSSKKYKKAAEKHYKTCKHLLGSIDTVKADVKPQVISNIFYLSGYILECIFKSSLLDADHKTKGYTLEEIETMGLKTHKLFGSNNLWAKITDRGILDRNKFMWTELSKEWNESVRYETEKYEIILVVKHFNETVIPIYNALKEKY